MKRRRHRSRRRRHNPFRRRHSRRRGFRRNPGFFSGLLSPIKEHGIGFLAGEAANHFLVDPLLTSFLPASVVSPSKIVVGPLIGNLGKRFLPRFGKHFDSLALFMVALGVHETVGGFLGGGGTKGLGWSPRRRMGAIGPTGARGIAAIGPTSSPRMLGAGMHGFGALSPSGEQYEQYQSDGSY